MVFISILFMNGRDIIAMVRYLFCFVGIGIGPLKEIFFEWGNKIHNLILKLFTR